MADTFELLLATADELGVDRDDIPDEALNLVMQCHNVECCYEDAVKMVERVAEKQNAYI